MKLREGLQAGDVSREGKLAVADLERRLGIRRMQPDAVAVDEVFAVDWHHGAPDGADLT